MKAGRLQFQVQSELPSQVVLNHVHSSAIRYTLQELKNQHTEQEDWFHPRTAIALAIALRQLIPRSGNHRPDLLREEPITVTLFEESSRNNRNTPKERSLRIKRRQTH